MQGLTASEFFNSSGNLYDSDEELDLEDVFPNKLKDKDTKKEELPRQPPGNGNNQPRSLHASWSVLEEDDFIKGIRQCHRGDKTTTETTSTTKHQDSLHQSWQGNVQVRRRNRKDRPSNVNRSLNTSWHTLASASDEGKRMIKSSCLTPPRRPRKVRQRDDHNGGSTSSLRSLGSNSHHSITEHDESSSHIDLDESKGSMISMNSSGVSFGSQSLIDGGDDSGGLGGSNRSNFSLDKSGSDDGPPPRRSRSRPKSGRSNTRRSGSGGPKSRSRSRSSGRFSSAGSSTKSTERRSRKQDSDVKSRPTRSSNNSESKKRLSNRSKDSVDGDGSDSDEKQGSTSPKPLTRIRVSVENPDATETSSKQAECAEEVEGTNLNRRSADRSRGTQKSRTSRKDTTRSSRSKKAQHESRNSERGSRSRSRTRQSSRRKPTTSAVVKDDGNATSISGIRDNDNKQRESKNLDGKKQCDDKESPHQTQKGSRNKLNEGNDNKIESSSKATQKLSKAYTTEETQKNRSKLRLTSAVSLSPKFLNNRRHPRGLKNLLTSNNLGGSMRHLALSSDDDDDHLSMDDENAGVDTAGDGGAADIPPPRQLIRKSSSFSDLEELSNRGNMAQLHFLHKGEAVATIEDVKLLDMSKSTRAALGISKDD